MLMAVIMKLFGECQHLYQISESHCIQKPFMARPVLVIVLLNIPILNAYDQQIERDKLVNARRQDLDKYEVLGTRKFNGLPEQSNTIEMDYGSDVIEQRFLKAIRDKAIRFLKKQIDLNNIPFEIHLPGYQFCGPGTKAVERLSKGELGINKLDAACREHDMTYLYNADVKMRASADRILAEKAYDIYLSPQSSLEERLSAFLVAKIMTVKYKVFTEN